MKTLFIIVDNTTSKKIKTANKIKADKFLFDAVLKPEANFSYQKIKISNEKYSKLLWSGDLNE